MIDELETGTPAEAVLSGGDAVDETAVDEASGAAPEPAAPGEPPMEVIRVDELLSRLEPPAETPAADEAELVEAEPVDSAEDAAPVQEIIAAEPLEVAGTEETHRLLQAIEARLDHPMLTTPFQDYTVVEGLLLLVLLLAVVSLCIKMLKGGFSWLLW